MNREKNVTVEGIKMGKDDEELEIEKLEIREQKRRDERVGGGQRYERNGVKREEGKGERKREEKLTRRETFSMSLLTPW